MWTHPRRVLYLRNPAQGQYYAAMSLMGNGGTASYNGLFLSVQKRLSRGFTLLTNYTWSHCISDVFDNQFLSGSVGTRSDTRRASRSNCGTSDQRHVFNLSAVAQAPKFSNRKMQMIAGDLQFSPILKICRGHRSSSWIWLCREPSQSRKRRRCSCEAKPSTCLSGPHTLESGAPVVVDAPDLFQPGNSGVRLFWKTDQVRFRMDVCKNVIGILEEVVRLVISGDVPPAFITEIGETLDHVPCVLHRGLDEDNRPQFTNGSTRAVQHLWFHAFNVDFYQVALVKRETVEGDHIGRNAFSLATRFHCTSITFARGIYQGNLDRTR